MSVSDEKTTVSDGIMLSDAAAGKVKALLDQEGRDDLALRVAVQPGGCSGLRYQLFFDERSSTAMSSRTSVASRSSPTA